MPVVNGSKESRETNNLNHLPKIGVLTEHHRPPGGIEVDSIGTRSTFLLLPSIYVFPCGGSTQSRENFSKGFSSHVTEDLTLEWE